jgi:DNA-binding response OmpR family regulator
LGSVLRDAGFRVHTATNGEDALATAMTTQPDVAIVDLFLPDVEGTALLGALGRAGDIPMIVMSASGDRGSVLSMAAGARAYVAKPFPIDTLLGHIDAVLAPPLE